MLRRLIAATCALVFVLAGCDAPDPSPFEVAPRAGAWSPNIFDIAYGSAGQRLDVHRSVSTNRRGTIVYVHGGGFYMGDKGTRPAMEAIITQLQRGWDIVAVDYRLVNRDQNRYPAAYHDIVEAVRWVHGAGRNLVNTDRVVVAGHSAGGTLAALVGLRPDVQVDGWISVAGIMDFAAGPQSEFFGRVWLGTHYDTRKRSASPYASWSPQSAPGYVIHGDSDRVVEAGNATIIKGTAGDAVYVDIVDRWADGRAMDLGMRDHIPSGANLASLNRWLDLIK